MLTCVILVNDTDLEKILIDCVGKFPSIEIIDILYDNILALERIHQIQPDLFIMDVDDLANIEMMEMGNHVGVSFALTRRSENTLALLNKGFYDILTVEDLCFNSFFRKMNKLFKFIYFFRHKAANQSLNGKMLNGKTPDDLLTSESMFVRHNKKSVKVYLTDILYVKNQDNVLELFMADGRVIQHNSTLRKFMKSLPVSQFVRINNATVINHHKIEEFSKKNLRIGGATFTVSKSYIEGLRNALNL